MEVRGEVIVPAVPEKKVEKVIHILCDICGTKGEDKLDGEVEWENHQDNDDLTTTVTMKKGMHYEGGGTFTLKTYHICPFCFEGTLALFMEKFGKPTKTEQSW